MIRQVVQFQNKYGVIMKDVQLGDRVFDTLTKTEVMIIGFIDRMSIVDKYYVVVDHGKYNGLRSPYELEIIRPKWPQPRKLPKLTFDKIFTKT